MKAYRGVDGQIRIFRPEQNMKRMNITAQRAALPTFDGNELIELIKKLIRIDQEWVPHAESSSLYIRPTLISNEVGSCLAPFGVFAPNLGFDFVLLLSTIQNRIFFSLKSFRCCSLMIFS